MCTFIFMHCLVFGGLGFSFVEFEGVFSQISWIHCTNRETHGFKVGSWPGWLLSFDYQNSPWKENESIFRVEMKISWDVTLKKRVPHGHMDTLSYRNLYNAQLLQEPNANLRVDHISTIPNHLPILIVCHPRLRPGRAVHGLIAQPPARGTAGPTGCSCCHGRAAQMRAVVDGSMAQCSRLCR
jgi:hypothetical protein